MHSILHQFNQQNLALTLWAFAKLAWCPPTDLLSDAASLAVASLHTSNSQNLSNTLWAFATLGFMPQAGLLEVCCSPYVAQRVGHTANFETTLPCEIC